MPLSCAACALGQSSVRLPGKPPNRLGKRSPELRYVPGRRDHIDVVDAKPQRGAGRLERMARELLGMLLSVEALFFQYEDEYTVIQQGDAAVMRLSDDAQNFQGNYSAVTRRMLGGRSNTTAL